MGTQVLTARQQPALPVPKALRWVAALLLTWLLAGTVLAGLIEKFGAGSLGFAIVLNMALPMWVVAFFAIADPPIDHPWLERVLSDVGLGA